VATDHRTKSSVPETLNGMSPSQKRRASVDASVMYVVSEGSSPLASRVVNMDNGRTMKSFFSAPC